MEKYRLRSRWSNMLSRCEDEDNPQYKDYGGKGIGVCDEWREFENFYEWCLGNGFEPHLQIDRINNDGSYSPENCRFATRRQNARNKSTNKMISAFGETKCLADWIDDSRCNVSYTVLYRRLSIGWEAEEAMTKPTGGSRSGRTAHNAKTHEAFGESKTINEWASDPRTQVGAGTLRSRLNDGWEIERAMTEPTQFNKGLVFEGRTIFQWSQDADCEVSYNTLARRLKNGVHIEEAKRK